MCHFKFCNQNFNLHENELSLVLEFHSIQEVKDKIVSHIEVEADQWLGSAMTYTLFQSVQENLPELLIDQPTAVTHIEPSTSNLKEPVIIKV